jgi:ureidoglycolate dehydrogenase (NAD+)
VLLDMSTATVAGGKVYAARARGESIPDTWLIDANGRPTTDPTCYPESGALQPRRGHKGYGISLLIEMLSGVLTGALVTRQVGSWMWDDGTQPTGHGAAFIAIDVNTIMPTEEFARRMESLVDEIHAAPRADGVERLFVPGEMEWERHTRAMEEGIALPEDVVASLRKAAEMVGLDFDAVAKA